MRSSLIEGLEDISEDEQLRQLLEMSRVDTGSFRGSSTAFSSSPTTFSSSPTTYSSSPSAAYSSPTATYSSSPSAILTPSSRRPSTPPKRTEEMNLEDWRRMSTEERMRMFHPDGIREHSPPVFNQDTPENNDIEEENNVNDNTTEEEKDILKKILEQSKIQTHITEEEKTKMALEQSLREHKERLKYNEIECNLNLQAGEPSKPVKIANVPKEPSFNLDWSPTARPETSFQELDESELQKKKEREEVACAIIASLAMDIQTPVPRPSSLATPPRPRSQPAPAAPPSPPASRPRSQPIPTPTSTPERALGAVPRRRQLSTAPATPPPRDTAFPPLGAPAGEEEQLAWALRASQEEARALEEARTPPVEEEVEVVEEEMDEEQQLAWALQASTATSTAPSAAEPSAVPDLMSVLSPEEQVELAMRLSSAAAPAQSSSPPRSPEPLQPRAQALQPRAQPVLKPRATAQPRAQAEKSPTRRLVVIDGMNVAMAHGLHRKFSVRGLVLAYEYFRERGNQVAIFLPKKKLTFADPEDREILLALEQTQILFLVQNVAYDDKFVIDYAVLHEGVILSNDRYRDVLETHGHDQKICDQIRNRTVQFTWAMDVLMIAEDPFGRHGPTLEQLLVKK